VGGQLDVKTI